MNDDINDDDTRTFRRLVVEEHFSVHIERLCHQERAESLELVSDALNGTGALAFALFSTGALVFRTPVSLPHMRMCLLTAGFVGIAHTFADAFRLTSGIKFHDRFEDAYMNLEDRAHRLQIEASTRTSITDDMHKEYKAITYDHCINDLAARRKIPGSLRARIIQRELQN